MFLAQLLAEDRHPPESFWARDGLIASRLLEYEAWTRLHGRGLGESHGDDLRALLGRLSLLELAPPVLARALDPFDAPLRTLDAPLRTLDALHLASMLFLVGLGQRPSLATYDGRMAAAARAADIPVIDPDRDADDPVRGRPEAPSSESSDPSSPDPLPL